MPWNRRQIIKLQIYKRAAALSDPDYRDLLAEVTGARSSTEPGNTQWHYDQVMAKIEAILDYRVQEGIVGPPPKHQVPRLTYWRGRLATGGAMNARQRYRIDKLWAQLCQYLPPDQRTPRYLAGIASQASASRVRDTYSLKAWQASMLIDALKDRLRHALRHTAQGQV